MVLSFLSDCYVADELVVSRAGRRVRVGNTDAEGRMVMVDLLCEMKEKVRIHKSIAPSLHLSLFLLSNPFCHLNLTSSSCQKLTVSDYTPSRSRGTTLMCVCICFQVPKQVSPEMFACDILGDSC